MSVPNRAGHPNRQIGDHTTPLVERAKETNSAGGSRLQSPASVEAEKIGKSWMAQPAHRFAHTAVVWHQNGARSEGTFVTPARDPKTGESGIHLHSTNTGATFHKDTDVSEVHFLEKPGMPSSSEREETYRKSQAERNQTVD